MKKKLICVLAALMLALPLMFGTFGAYAEDYSVDIPEGYNLATNRFNWAMPTLSTAEFTVDETSGMRFENFVSNQQCTTMFTGGRFGEFKLSMYVNANLRVPDEGKAQWRYSEFFITFLVDRDMEDLVAEDSKPWYANKVYMSLSIGLTSGGTPICKFMRYNAFANNCSISGQNYVGTSASPVTNIADGGKHWVELEVKNYRTENSSGKRMIAYVDGAEAASYDYEDDAYYDPDTKRDYDVVASELEGAIGFYANSDWPAGYSPAKMNNWMGIEKMSIINYDNNPEGEYVEQMTEPEFEITAKDYITAASYEVGDLIEVQLTDLFDYEGTNPVEYEITCDGAAIGSVSNGFWAWTPDKAGNYDVTVKATVSEENTATNYLTLRVKGGAVSESSNTETSTGGSSSNGGNGSSCGGCGGAMGVQMLGISALISLGLLKSKRK